MTTATMLTMAFPSTLAGDSADWLELGARLHSVALQLPIGLLVVACLIELWALVLPSDDEAEAGLRRVVHVGFALSTAAAAGSGWALGQGPEFGGDLFDHHRTLGLASASLAVLVALFDLVGRSAAAAFARRTLLVACVCTLLFAAQRGGALARGRSFLSDPAPGWLAPWLRFELPGPADPERSPALRTQAPAQAPEALAQASGARITPLKDRLPSEIGPALDVDWGATQTDPSREQLAALAPIAAQIVKLGANGQAMSADLETLPNLPNLRIARFGRCGLGDDAVAALVRRAPTLVELNLHGTKITAKALDAIAELAALERLVVSETGLATADLAPLQRARPELSITWFGDELPVETAEQD